VKKSTRKGRDFTRIREKGTGWTLIRAEQNQSRVRYGRRCNRSMEGRSLEGGIDGNS
jgi:hypothetical protein